MIRGAVLLAVAARAGRPIRALLALAALAAAAGGAYSGARVRRSDALGPLTRPPRGVAVPRFVESSRRAGIDGAVTATGCDANVSGGAWADVEGNGRLDAFVPSPRGSSHLWINRGDGRFIDRARAAGLAGLRGATSAVFADYDNDGRPDLYVAGIQGGHLFHNDGGGKFHDVTASAGLTDSGPSVGAAWGDFDRDGRLDLYVVEGDNCVTPRPTSGRLFRNLADGRFADVTRLLGGGGTNAGIGQQAAWVDFTGHGRPDLYLANDYLGYKPNAFWRNAGPGAPGWRFVPAARPSGADLAISSMGIGVGDLDADGRPDLVVSDLYRPPHLLLWRRGRFVSRELPAPARGNPPPITWGLAVGDVNNDGYPDVIAAGGDRGVSDSPQPNLLYLGQPGGRFIEVGRAAGLGGSGRGRGVALADLNHDGRLDVLVTRLGQPPELFINRGVPGGAVAHWLELRLVGTSSPRDPCGAQAVVFAGGRPSFDQVSCGSQGPGSGEHLIHVGLGTADRVDSILILWPDGHRQRLGPRRADRLIEVTERA